MIAQLWTAVLRVTSSPIVGLFSCLRTVLPVCLLGSGLRLINRGVHDRRPVPSRCAGWMQSAAMATTSYSAVRILLFVLAICMQSCLVTTQAQSPPPPNATVAAPPAPISGEPPPRAGGLQPQPQVVNMIAALRDAGQFSAMTGILDGLQMKSLTPMTTWLMPTDEAFSNGDYPTNFTQFLDYHVLRELLPFSRLLTLQTGTRMPTFLGAATCAITRNLQFNFSIDNAMVVVPDLYTDSTVAVHGISAILDAAKFSTPSEADSPSAPVRNPSPPPSGTGPLLNITFLPNTGYCWRLASERIPMVLAGLSVAVLIA